MYKLFGKRLFDITLSFLALIILIPLFLILFLLVRISLGSPVFFIQKRPGKNERVFKLYKFRTMNESRAPSGELLPDDQRLTKLGKLLRSTSLDELPELINILKGDMSFVGPRPLLVRYLDRYDNHQKRRHEVRPGITGLAQVNGRNTISWEQRFEYDIWYVDHISFLRDIKIIIQTIWVVLKRQDINSYTSATMEEFEGKNFSDQK